VVAVKNGQLRGLSEGSTTVAVTYTDPMGNELTTSFAVRSTFFPFGAQYINTSLFAEGTYDEATHTFKPGQWGQMGWTYPNGADMSGYKYLVVKLRKAQNCGAHLNIFTTNSIWGDCYGSADFGSKKLIPIPLKTAKLTSGDHKGQALDTRNIHIVSFWANGSGTIEVEDIYLTNNDDYSPSNTSVDGIITVDDSEGDVYSLSGQVIRRAASSRTLQDLPRGIYIIGGKKRIVR
jgi:hypothetical protein